MVATTPLDAGHISIADVIADATPLYIFCSISIFCYISGNEDPVPKHELLTHTEVLLSCPEQEVHFPLFCS